MQRRSKTVRQYLDELRESRNEKPQQVRQALETYIDLWERAIDGKVVSATDEMEEALTKIDRMGGLYKASQPETGPG